MSPLSVSPLSVSPLSLEESPPELSPFPASSSIVPSSRTATRSGIPWRLAKVAVSSSLSISSAMVFGSDETNVARTSASSVSGNTVASSSMAATASSIASCVIGTLLTSAPSASGMIVPMAAFIAAVESSPSTSSRPAKTSKRIATSADFATANIRASSCPVLPTTWPSRLPSARSQASTSTIRSRGIAPPNPAPVRRTSSPSDSFASTAVSTLFSSISCVIGSPR